MISIQNVTKSFGHIKAVDDLSVDIPKGQITGFLGPNGAGKTTTIRIMTGFIEPDSGSVMVDKQPNTDIAVSRKIGYLPENNPLYGEMLVSEFLDFTARLCDIPKQKIKEAVDYVTGRTEISSVFYRPINELSKGFRQRTGLAAAIIHNPEILILDEPTEGLDPNQRIEMRKLIKELGKDKTIILSSHVMQEVEATCERIIIMDNGKMLADKSIGELLDVAKNKIVTVEIEGIEDEPVTEMIKEIDGVLDIKVENVRGNVVKLQISTGSDIDIRPELFRISKDKNWNLIELHLAKSSLETVFGELTKGAHE